MSERPRQGPIRRIYMAFYWFFALNFVFSTLATVTWFVLMEDRPTGPQVAATVTPKSAEGQACAADLNRLFDALRQQAKSALDDGPGTADKARGWEGWTQTWRKDLTQVTYTCRLDQVSAMAPLAQTAQDLDRLRQGYSTAIKGFSEEGADSYARMNRVFGNN